MPVYLILAFIIFSPWWLAAIIFLTIPVSGIFAWNYNIIFRRIIGGFRVRRYISSGNKDYSALKNDYDELVNLVSALKDEQ
jgi:hypothetical protein